MTDNRRDVLEEKPYVGAFGRLLIAALFLIAMSTIASRSPRVRAGRPLHASCGARRS